MSDKATRNAVIGVAAATVLLVIALMFANSLKGPSPEEVRDQQRALRESLVWSCTYQANPLREVIQSMIREEIHSSANVKPSFFPNIPPKVLHHLIRVQNRAKRQRLEQAAPVNCEEVFPPEP